MGKKLLAALLSLLLLVELMPMQVFALSTVENTVTTVEADEGQYEEPYEETEPQREILGEVEEYRDADTKHFLNTDGSYTAVKYAQPVHYRTTAEGEWEDINNTLVLTDANKAPGVNRARQAGSSAFGQDTVQVYVPQSSPLDIILAKDSGAAYLATLNSGTHTLSWRYAMDRGVQLEALACSDARAITFDSDADADESAQTRAVRNVTRGLVYPNVAANVDLEYILDSLYLKENIVLKAPTAPNSFRLTYAVGDLKARQISAQEIVLVDADGETVFTIYAPYMVDANMTYSGGVTLEILSQQNGELTVELTADSTWLQDPARSYPVKIDPYVFQGVVDTDKDASAIYNAHSYIESRGTLYVGNAQGTLGRTRSYIKFDLPSLSAGDVVIEGGLRLTQFTALHSGYSAVGHDSLQINAYQVTSPWTLSSVCNSTSFIGLPSMDSTVVDYRTVSASTCGSAVFFDITKMVKAWYESSETNHGICLEAADTTAWATVKFNSTDNPETPESRPYLSITYLNSKGLEGRWTNHTQSLGRSGGSYINDYTGNLVFVAPITSTTGNRMPVSISLVYNGFQHRQQIERGNTVGNGWRLNIQEKIIPISGSGSDPLYVLGYRYIYEDGDGTRHYFKLKENSTTVCEDEEGMGLTLEKYSSTTNGERYEIRSDAGGKMTFTQDGYLKRVIDSDGNYYRINYASGTNRIDSVTDGAGRDIIFTYSASSGRILHITDPSSRVTKFYYSADTYDYLTKIEYPDGEKTEFAYDSDGHMTGVTGTDGCVLAYEYPTSDNDAVKNRVKKVTEYGTDNTQGNSLTMDYSGINRTVFTDNQNRSETYQFDNYGRTVSIRDATGNMGTYSYVSGEELSNKTANALKSASVATRFVNNMLCDHSFERGSGVWSRSSGTAQIVTDKYYLGSHSLKLTGSDAWASQDVSVTAGNYYTLSAYMKNNAAATAATVSMRFMDASGNTLSIVTSNPVDYLNGNWQRICVSGRAPEGAVTVRVRCMTAGAGDAWFDCLQLETGASVNAYNLVEDGNFDTPSSGVWQTYGTSTGEGFASSGSDGYYRLNGSTTGEKTVLQTVYVNRAAAQSFFSVSAGSSGSSVPLSGQRRYAVALRAYFTDGTSSPVKYVSFNPDYAGGWQYASGTVSFGDREQDSAKTVSYVNVFCCYAGNANYALFDNVQLNMDMTGVTYTYDEAGNLVSARDNASRNRTYSYNDAGEVTNVNTVDNKNYTFTYADNNKHRLLSAVSQSSAVKISLGYDSYGNVTSTRVQKSDGSGKYIKQTTEYADSGNYVDKVYSDRGYATDYDYNSYKGTLSRVTDPNGNATEYVYNAGNDRLTQVYNVSESTDTSTSVVNYTYDGDRLSKLETHSTTYAFTYDIFGNAKKTKAGGYTLAENTYAANNGHLASTRYGNNDTVSYEYDNLDRVTKTYYNGVNKHEWSYNAAGQVGRYWDKESGRNYTYTYDDLGRPLRVDVSDGSWLQSGYNILNQSTEQKYHYNGTTQTVSHTYSDRDNLPASTSFYGGSVTNGYDSLTRLYKKTYQTGSGHSDMEMEFGFIDWTSEQNRTSGTVRGIVYRYDHSQLTVPDLYYTYDNAGNILTEKVWSESLNYPLREKYTYDGKNQLIRHDSVTRNATFTYSYDNAGNIKSVKRYAYTTGDLGAVQSTANYTYATTGNWKDLLVNYNGHAISYDGMGNMTSYNGNTYTWQGRQLSKIQGGGNTYTYKYNADGIRTSKTVNGTTTEYFLSGTQILAQKTGSETLWFFYDSTGQRVAVLCGGVLYYYVYNLQGDVIALARAATGEIVVKYAYDAWGNCTVTNASGYTVGTKNPFRYRGYYYDAETGLYYLNSRYYSPEFGRFISADVFVSTGQGVLGSNMFAYCNNNPVMYGDPSGEYLSELWDFIETTAAEIGKAIGALSPVYAGCGGVAVADGPLPIGDVAGLIVAGIATIGAVGVGIYHAAKAPSISAPRIEEKVDARERDKNYNYWQADLINRQLIISTPLTLTEACARVAMGGSIMCRNEEAALVVIHLNGYQNFVGPETGIGEGFFPHYHPTRNHTGYASIHIWFFQ